MSATCEEVRLNLPHIECVVGQRIASTARAVVGMAVPGQIQRYDA